MAYISVACVIIYVICFAVGLGKYACTFPELVAECIYRYVITLGLRSKYDVMVTISDPRRESLRLCLAGWPQYDVTLLSYIPQLYFVCKHLIHCAFIICSS